MVWFGPSGNDVLFYKQGNKGTIDAPRWLADFGLSAFEYSFGRGIRLSEALATAIGEQARVYKIKMSAHAPYYINLASNDADSIMRSYMYIEKSLRILRCLGGNHLVVHVGSQGNMTREVALKNCADNLVFVTRKLREDGYADFKICIEVMGKYKAIGNVEEICDLCVLDEMLIPTLDFGHINCLLQGELTRSPNKARDILAYCIDKVGMEKMKNVHIHFSAVEFSHVGEKMHVEIDDEKYGIDFAPLARAIKEFKLEPTVICESHDTMAQDALKLKRVFEAN